MTTILAPRCGYFQYLDLHHVRASHFDSCSSSVYEGCYPVRLTLDAWKKKHLYCQRHWELKKNQCVCVCCILPAPDVVSAVKEVPIGVEGYDDDVDGARAKDDREVFERGGCGGERPVTVIRWLEGAVGYKMA
jgi:hypothetical protein